MSEELPNPVLSDEIDAKFMEAAAAADRGDDIKADLLPEKPAEEVVETEENVPTEAELADPANKDRARDPETGKFIKRKPEAQQTAPIEAVDASKTAPAGELSPFEQKKQEKAAKEKERQDRSWENLNREKEELAARRKEIADYEQRLKQPQQQRQAPQKREYSAQQLFDARNEFKESARAAFKRYQDTGNEAELDEFNKFDQMADQAEASAIQFSEVEMQEAQQMETHQRQQAWIQNMNATMSKNPELGKPDSPISLKLQELLKADGNSFEIFPDGFVKATRVAQLMLDAEGAPTLREENKKLKAEVERLNALTAPSSGGVTSAPTKTAKKADEMTDEDFIRAAQQVDYERAT